MRGVGRRFLVWLVATTAAAEAFLQGVVATMHGHVGETAVWILGSAGIFAVAAVVERVKFDLGE